MNENLPKVRRTFYSVVVKRALDILLSGIALVMLSPLLLIICVLELIFHGWPVVFVQKRPGLNGEIFHMYKFRSMTNETDENGNLLPGSQRVTKFGKFIRRFSIDELPELFCILSGKMSIIGPRALMPEYLELYSPRHMMRHAVKPGLACVPWTWNDQFENDLYYVEHVSFKLDVQMVAAMVKEAVKGSEYRTGDTRGKFTGENLNQSAS